MGQIPILFRCGYDVEVGGKEGGRRGVGVCGEAVGAGAAFAATDGWRRDGLLEGGYCFGCVPCSWITTGFWW